MKTQRERMLAGELYKIDDELAEMMKNARILLKKFNDAAVEDVAVRTALIKKLVAETGENVFFEPPFRCDYGNNIFLGENFYANFECIMLDIAPIRIGENVMFGPRVSLYTAGHPLDPTIRNSGLEFGKPITIGDNVWIGGDTVVNPGVTIGDNVVIGSGSVVTKDIPANTVAAGNPCRVLKAVTVEETRYWEELKAQYEAEMTE